MVSKWTQQLIKGDILCEDDLQSLCEQAINIFSTESNLLQLHSPITICGDIHGQFYDLLELFRIGGMDTPYIFLGDYVDRGYNSIETLEYLLCMKVQYPDRISLLRGNHESRQITCVYGLYDEICKKYGDAHIWSYITKVFDIMPVSAVIYIIADYRWEVFLCAWRA